MNKKIFLLVLVSIFLIASVGFITAADSANIKDIHVKKVWKDTGFENERPTFIEIQLFVDGKLVNTTKLNESNEWKATFKDVEVSGEVKVVENTSYSNYNVSYSGNIDDGFIITSTILKTPGKDVNGNASGDNGTNPIKGNSTNDNGTVPSGNNGTIPSNDNRTDNNSSVDVNVNVNESVTVKEVSKEKTPDKKSNDTVTYLRNTGFPVAILVIGVLGAVFIPLLRRKD